MGLVIVGNHRIVLVTQELIANRTITNNIDKKSVDSFKNKFIVR